MLIEDLKRREKDDPLSSLYQLDADHDNSPNIDLNALVNTLDDLEIIGVFEDKLKEMINVDEVTGMRTLNQLEQVIHKIRREHIRRANKEWRFKLSTAFDFLY